MDDAFVNLEDISDEQTLERLESLFETTNNFPTVSVDDGIFSIIFVKLLMFRIPARFPQLF
jgi:hypothetical protein